MLAGYLRRLRDDQAICYAAFRLGAVIRPAVGTIDLSHFFRIAKFGIGDQDADPSDTGSGFSVKLRSQTNAS